MATSLFRENFPAVTALQSAADAAAYIIGLDLHAKTTALCVVDPRTPDAPVFQRKRLLNAELLDTLNRFAGKKVIACEAAFGWRLLRDALAPLTDATFVPLDARKTSAWIASSGIKNDAIDAQVLCHACLHGGIHSLAVYAQNTQAYEGSKLVRYRDHLVRQRTAIKHQMISFDRDYGPNPYSGEIPEQSILVSSIAAHLRQSLEESNARLGTIDALMKAMSKLDPIVTLLATIPGIGPVTAFALRHKIDTIDRFKDAAHLSSYLGFGVRERQSGDSMVKGRITKTGDPLLRKLLIQGAQIIRSRRPDLVTLYFPALGEAERMRNRIHANKVVTAVARKTLTLAFHLWKQGKSFDVEIYRERRQTVLTAGATLPASPTCPSIVAADLVSPLVS